MRARGWTATANWVKIQLFRIPELRFSHPLRGETGVNASRKLGGESQLGKNPVVSKSQTALFSPT